MMMPPPRSTSTYTLCPFTALFRSPEGVGAASPLWMQGARVIRDGDAWAADRPSPLALPLLVLLALISAGLVIYAAGNWALGAGRSEEHTSELQSLVRISYAVFCLKKKKTHKNKIDTTTNNHA